LRLLLSRVGKDVRCRAKLIDALAFPHKLLRSRELLKWVSINRCYQAAPMLRLTATKPTLSLKLK
jgi:hypothetical protein